MPLLGAADPLPRRPLRVVVAGTSGAGKTTTVRRIAEVTGAPHVEIDGLFHGPGWVPRPSFVADVDAFTAGPAWVTEWQYSEVRARLAARADLFVWLDLPRATVMRQVVRRTVRRRLRHEILWNGNVEPPLHTVLTDPEHVVRWAWSTYRRNRVRAAALSLRRPELTIVRLRSHRQVARWIDGPLSGSVG
ncbi:adenylate kinase [Virgisporangium aliadipatigenens]|uniref:Adenylate kinase n=1 Tax=Virgisporangium aliadipatigenens TaxID=741659 RepID=A0A8J3YHF6_9ACTN|nr:AAA family ATPase [Virgisporangium aliadipatigenens]GIJ44268.1 adenylate kinase [Virgisporangium aliadipatigenens]